MEMNGITAIGRSIDTVFAYVNDVSNTSTGVTGLPNPVSAPAKFPTLDRSDTLVLETLRSSGEWSRTLPARV